MNREQIERQVIKYLTDSLNGLEVENPKVDFKRQWYNLTDLESINEFLKDTTAIANTVGLDGFIIIGFDDKNKTFHNTTFKDSLLSDSSRIPDIIIKRCSNLFDLNTYDIDFNGNYLSVIHIPPTLEKPIFITNYQKKKTDTGIPHRVFIRKNSTVREASKYDIEMMFYDRKNIQPEYDIELQLAEIKLATPMQSNGSFSLYIKFHYENLGRKSISVNNITLILDIGVYELKSDYYNYSSTDVLTISKNSNGITSLSKFDFIQNKDKQVIFDISKGNINKISAVVKINNGNYLFFDFPFIPKVK